MMSPFRSQDLFWELFCHHLAPFGLQVAPKVAQLEPNGVQNDLQNESKINMLAHGGHRETKVLKSEVPGVDLGAFWSQFLRVLETVCCFFRICGIIFEGIAEAVIKGTQLSVSQEIVVNILVLSIFMVVCGDSKSDRLVVTD